MRNRLLVPRVDSTPQSMAEAQLRILPTITRAPEMKGSFRDECVVRFRVLHTLHVTVPVQLQARAQKKTAPQTNP